MQAVAPQNNSYNLKVVMASTLLTTHTTAHASTHSRRAAHATTTHATAHAWRTTHATTIHASLLPVILSTLQRTAHV